MTTGTWCGHRLDRGYAAIASIMQIRKFLNIDFMRQKKKESVCDVFDCYKKMKMLLCETIAKLISEDQPQCIIV